MSSVFSIFVQLFFGNFGGIRKKRGFRHRLVYKASRVFEETIFLKGETERWKYEKPSFSS